jgi:ankyrin repeat protein
MKRKLIFICCIFAQFRAYSSDHTQTLIDYLENLEYQNVESSVVIEKIDHLIKAGADADGRSSSHESPLMVAVQSGQKKNVLEFLIKHGANINARNHYGKSPMVFALASGKRNMIELLVELGAKIYARDLSQILDQEFDVSFWKFLLSHCDNLQERFDKQTLLHFSASHNHNVTRLLLNQKIDLHAKDLNDGSSALHSACKTLVTRLFKGSGQYEIDTDYEHDLKALIAELVKRGIDVNVVDDHGTTPLHIVVKSSHVDLQPVFIDLLTSLGADPLKKDHNGLSPLHYAAHADSPDYISDTLLAAVKKYKPEILAPAEAELKEDNEVVKESVSKKTQIKARIDFLVEVGLHTFAVVGLYHLIRPCIKSKRS